MQTLPTPLPGLSRKRKAAMIVQLLLSDGNKLGLQSLPEHVQEDLAREMGAIRLVDRDTLNAVAEEFAGLLSAVGLSAPGGAAAALDALNDHISPDLARRLRAGLKDDGRREPWAQVMALPPETLEKILSRESVQIGAVLLSKLSVTLAADLLGRLQGPQARRITYAINQTADILPVAVTRIGVGLCADYCNAKVTAFEKPPVDRVGAILNSSQAQTREEMLTGLDTDDADFARDVRKAIFTFGDMPDRMTPTDIPGALRAVPADDLSTAIAFSLAAGEKLEAAAEFILANISQRMAAQMRETAQELGRIKTSEGEAAMNAVTAVIRDMADRGELKLRDPDATEDAD